MLQQAAATALLWQKPQAARQPSRGLLFCARANLCARIRIRVSLIIVARARARAYRSVQWMVCVKVNILGAKGTAYTQ